MPLSLALGLTLSAEWQRTAVRSLFEGGPDIVVRTLVGQLGTPKASPRGGWSFDLLSVVALREKEDENDRIRVFGQSRQGGLLSPEASSAFMACLFDFNYSGLKLDHSPQFGDGCIDVYLATEGQPGGEQLFGEDPVPMKAYVSSSKVNTVYVYDAPGVTNPLEACRELAHEYGHATLPAVRVPKGPEEWANGDLGERVYLCWLRDQAVAGKVKPAHVFGASTDSLKAYCANKVDRLVGPVAVNGPDPAVLRGGGQKAFDAYLGLALHVYRTLPIEVFRRSLVLNPDQSPAGYAKAVLEAVGEQAVVPIKNQGRKLLWVPTGSGGRVENGVVRAKKNGWSLIEAKGTVKIRNSSP